MTAAEARRAAGTLAVAKEKLEAQVAQKDAQLAEAKAWVDTHAPKLVGRGARILATGVAGACTGAAFGTFKPAYALAGAAVAATSTGLGSWPVKNPDVKDFLTCISGGVTAAATAIESARIAQTFWAERAAKTGGKDK